MWLLFQALVSLFSEEDATTLRACWAALGSVTATIAKEMQASYTRCLKEAVATAREKQRRKRRAGELLVPGFCLPKALAPVLPIYLQVSLIYVPGSRQSAACFESDSGSNPCRSVLDYLLGRGASLGASCVFRT